MKKIYGWIGRILRIDLTDNKIAEVPTTNYVPKFIGGRGVAAKIIWDEVPPEIKAFDPENRLIFMTGPCTGTIAPTSGRMIVAGKAAQTCPVESYARSGIGGYWGPELKFAGYDGVIVQGKAEEPIYIWISNDHVEIKNARDLWGLGAVDVQAVLRRRHGERVRTMAIGPAGEVCSRIAVIMTGEGSGAGQGGFGGVMGSKNLKAIAVRGMGSIPVARPEELAATSEHLWKLTYGSEEARETSNLWYGPGKAKEVHSVIGAIENSKIYPEVAAGSVEVSKPEMCYECPVARIGYHVEFRDGSSPPGTAQCLEHIGYLDPEQEYYGGKLWGRVAIEWSHLQQNMGINAWETGQSGNAPSRFPDCGGGMFWFRECIKEGLFTDGNTGLPVSKFGSREFALKQAQMIVEKKGIGRLWAEGVGRMTMYIRDHPEEFSLSKEQGERAYELYQKHYPRAGRFGGYTCHHFFCACGVGLGGLVNPISIIMAITDMCNYSDRHAKLARSTPGVRLYSPDAYKIADPIVRRWGLDGSVTDVTVWEGKGKATVVEQHFAVEKDCITFCDFVFPLIYSEHTPDKCGDADAGAKLWSAVTGIDKTQEELMVAYERIWNIERAMACRDGRRREDDWVNSWYFTYRDIWGHYLKVEDLKKAMDEYYTVRSWDLKTGVPTRMKLEALDLKDVADELEQREIL